MQFGVVVCAALVLTCGCGGKQTPAPAPASAPEQQPSQQATQPAAPPAAESGSKPVGTKLMQDVDASPKMFEIGENQGQGGLGKFSLRLDGKYIWPPQGKGCEPYVQCCNDLVAAREDLAVICLLALGRDGDCAIARGTVQQIAVEQAVAVPAACSR